MSKPNFLVFMTDQQNGDTQLPSAQAFTPNLDKLRANGFSFDQSYCVSPHCCPSRASFFTGLYPSEHGVWNNVDVSNTLSRGLFDNIPMFQEELKTAGYDLYFSGKWHVSAVEGPGDRSFEILHHEQRYHAYPNRADANEWYWYDRDPIDTIGMEKVKDGHIVRPGYTRFIQYGETANPFRDEDVINAAIGKLKEKTPESNPFFLYVGPLGPHDPYYVPEEYLALYKDRDIRLPDSHTDLMKDKPRLYQRTRSRYDLLSEREQIDSLKHYLAFCTYEDALFGRILDTLEAQNLLDNTYVIYLSDHGDYMGAHGLWAKGLPCFREAYHTCAVLGYGPDKRYRGRSDELVSITDWASTFLELAGIKTGMRTSGTSLLPLMNGTGTCWRTQLFTQSNGNEIYGIQRAVFSRKWKYVYNSFDFDELYDLENDPQETHNLADDPAFQDVILEMCRAMWQFAKEHTDNCVNPYIMTSLAPYGPGILKEKQSPR